MDAENKKASQRSLGAAVRQVMVQLGRLFEEEDPKTAVFESKALQVALASWQHAVETQTSGIDVQRARDLENAKLAMMGKAAQLEKERDDLLARNSELREEIVRLHKREQELKQEVYQSKFEGSGARADAKRLDLEVRELRRRVRALEGGPALSPAEAAPQSTSEKVDPHLATAEPKKKAPKKKAEPKIKIVSTKKTTPKKKTLPKEKAQPKEKAKAKVVPKKNAVSDKKAGSKKKKPAQKPIKRKTEVLEISEP
ncbi:MAG: hypothetical protein V1754_13295 [Pseudomonadota bacterium]